MPSVHILVIAGKLANPDFGDTEILVYVNQGDADHAMFRRVEEAIRECGVESDPEWGSLLKDDLERFRDPETEPEDRYELAQDIYGQLGEDWYVGIFTLEVR